MKIGMITLGCDKNRVDAEKILADVVSCGHEITSNPQEAEAIIVNTCGFIESAKKESISNILEMANYKNTGVCRLLIVTGCLAQRYKEELTSISEIDYILPIADNDRIASILGNNSYCSNNTSRFLTTPYNYAYLKIADGCNNCCTYCAIPKIRGRYVSTPIESIINEAKQLIDDYPVKELIVVAQDITRYGTDLYGRKSLITLLDKLSTVGVSKIRLLYCYPEQVDKELVDYIRDNPKICKYIDMPLQHVNNRILKLMNRRTSKEEIFEKLSMLRENIPNVAIRSSFITGFPTETDEEYMELLDFIKLGYIQYAGFFGYSREEGTGAYNLKPQVPRRIINSRIKELRQYQSGVLLNYSKSFEGSNLDVMYEGIDYDKQCFYGRTEYQAPDVDTKVYFTSKEKLQIGETYKIHITKGEYDLIGETL